MTQKCTSWLGHKFEARYSDVPRKEELSETVAALNGLTGYQAGLVLRELKAARYEHDICVRCGLVITPSRSETV